MGPRVYIHEFIDIRGHNRARYLQHMTANWVPIGRRERAQSCFGVWAVVGSTGRWPQVVNLWEYDGWDALGRNFDVELRGGGLQDPSLAEWWAAAADLRSGGFDRILVAPDWSPSVSDHEASGATNAAGYLHELIACAPGASGEVLDAVRDAAVPGYRVRGLALVGAFRRAMADDDEVVVIWSFRDWESWAEFERTDAAAGWRRECGPLIIARERILLADAPLSPLRLGRQPDESDRRPLNDCRATDC